MTLGFARRFAGYKRPTLLLHDPERLVRILTCPERPMQIIVAGKAHPQNEKGKQLVQAWAEFVQEPAVRDRAVFLEGYDISPAPLDRMRRRDGGLTEPPPEGLAQQILDN